MVSRKSRSRLGQGFGPLNAGHRQEAFHFLPVHRVDPVQVHSPPPGLVHLMLHDGRRIVGIGSLHDSSGRDPGTPPPTVPKPDTDTSQNQRSPKHKPDRQRVPVLPPFRDPFLGR